MPTVKLNLVDEEVCEDDLSREYTGYPICITCATERGMFETNPDPFRRDSTGQAYGFQEDDPMQVEW